MAASADAPPAARKTDKTAHGGAIVVGSPNVDVNVLPAARLEDNHTCPIHAGGPVSEGSETVLINGHRAARKGDHLMCALSDEAATAMIVAAWNELIKHPERAGLADWQKETGVDQGQNPYRGMHKETMLAAYKAGIATGTPPQDALALASKEGLNQNIVPHTTSGLDVPAGSADEARSLGRSQLFYNDLGMDQYTAFNAGAGDNTLVNDAAASDAAFNSGLQSQYGANSGGVASGINNGLNVTETSPGMYNVTPTNDFYSSSMAVGNDHFNTIGQNTFTGLGGEAPTPELNYMQWNMGTDKFRDRFLAGHPGASAADVDRWAMHTPPKENEWGQARRNAIRYGYIRKAYAVLYADLMAATRAQMDEIVMGSDNVVIGK
jgi:uncharacterized Zn-binding protein involved in type VI secretion